MTLQRTAVFELLKNMGPMSTSEIAALFPGVKHGALRTAVYRLRVDGRIVVVGKTYDDNAVYGVSKAPDAEKPRSARRTKKRIPRVNSVWALGALA